MRPVLGLLVFLAACGGPDAYRPCEQPADCEAPEDTEPVCLDKADEGFCTWACDADPDCEGVEGFVCAPFESAEGAFCFPACVEEAEDEDEVCPRGFTCRSTGGGAGNRRICFPDA